MLKTALWCCLFTRSICRFAFFSLFCVFVPLYFCYLTKLYVIRIYSEREAFCWSYIAWWNLFNYDWQLILMCSTLLSIMDQPWRVQKRRAKKNLERNSQNVYYAQVNCSHIVGEKRTIICSYDRSMKGLRGRKKSWLILYGNCSIKWYKFCALLFWGECKGWKFFKKFSTLLHKILFKILKKFT